MKTYFIYIATNWNNKVLYIGITNNLERRIYEHKQKLIKGFTQRYNIFKLVYMQSFSDVEDAIAAEKKMKDWLRKKKEDLITATNPGLPSPKGWFRMT